MPAIRWKACLFLLFAFLWTRCVGNDFLGCGGYVRSDVDINYAQVGVKLYTKQGNLKYETECAPNNGYYFMPIYDKGQYIIKVSPPSGWSFDPEEVSVKIDGETDACSQGKDINFHFKGFAVIGKVVSIGSSSGPEGVTVSLHRGDALIQTTQTSADGSYVFTPLSSGKYTVVAAHPTWTLIKNKVTVEVADENGDAGASIVVGGYSLSGSVITDGQPTSGVNFILHSQDTLAAQPACTPGSPAGYENTLGLPAMCYVVSDATGSFTFGLVSPGVYMLAPYFHSSTTKYEVTPSKLEVVVSHNDLVLQQPFKVEGFSMSGRVTKSPGGKVIAGAKILLDKVRAAVTDENGLYYFENIQSGKHKIKITADKLEFEEVTVNINPKQPVVGDLSPLKYEVCFSVTVEKTASHSGPWTIKITGEGKAAQTLQTDVDGRGCIYLTPGSYSASVKLSQAADEAGMRFGPLEHLFSVTSDPIEELAFSQFLGEISGRISCLEECPTLTVSLQPAQGRSGAPRSVTAKDGTFSITEVVPGSYLLSVQKDDWCWKLKTVPVTVNTQNVEVSLEQVGYQLTLASSHETTLSYTTTTGASGTIVAQKGSTLVCMSGPGMYTLTPVGCHKFGSTQINWNTSSPNLVTLSATKHQLTGAVRATEVAPFTVEVQSGSKTVLGPLNPSPENPHLYVFELWVREGETITLTPSSPTNLYQYEPSSHTLTMPADCVLNTVTFQAERALFIHGKITPPVSGVTITVEGNGKVYTYTSDADGKYVAGPLDNSVQYSVSAEKRGYVMNALSEKGHFEAYKLAEIVVEVKDEDGAPLPGVLLSMSGGKSYRQNSLTENDGTIGFLSLTPGDYFLRPMMKEYMFDPASKMVSVAEGATIMITIRGSRVAYSVYGHTVSLSGEAETDVVVEAVGQGPECDQYQEEAMSDAQGSFRIRGLYPKCQYELRLKKGSGINLHVQRTLPSVRSVHADNKDVRDLKLIVLRPFNQMDVAAKVDTDPQHLSSLVAQLYREDLPDSPIQTIKLGLHPYFMLPPMTADKRTYFLRLESNLPSSQYQYSVSEVSFVADSAFKHLNLSFKPTLRSVDAEMSQGTVVGFATAIILVMLAFNYDKMGSLMEKVSHVMTTVTAPRIAQKSLSATSEVPSTESGRKRVKPRKV
uniref:SD-repeat containing protein B domain-containing protein n=1 Tax=Scylla olivacea TaxID=85551 RepID=A0A0P4W9J4_SCYOL